MQTINNNIILSTLRQLVLVNNIHCMQFSTTTRFINILVGFFPRRFRAFVLYTHSNKSKVPLDSGFAIVNWHIRNFYIMSYYILTQYNIAK
jgi:hypothetical protein